MKWERIAREVVFEGRVFRVAADRVRLTDGVGSRETGYDVVLHPGAVAVVPLFEDGTVALVRQFRYAVGERILEIPAGTRHGDEPWAACAARELEEEAALLAGRWTELATFYTTPGFSDEEMRLFLAEDLTPGTAALDDDEDLDVERMPLADALAAVESGAVRDAKTIVGLALARERLRAEGRWAAR